jgi:hypothetical protein
VGGVGGACGGAWWDCCDGAGVLSDTLGGDDQGAQRHAGW